MAGGRLFRQEVLDAQSVQWLGAIRIARPVSDTIAAGLALCIVAGLGAFATFGSYTRRATVPGYLEPVGGTLRLTAPTTGTVVSARVVEGGLAKAGDVLFVLSGERRSATGATQALIAAQLSARRVALERDLRMAGMRHVARQRSARERLEAIDLESQRLEQEIEIGAARTGLAEETRERFDTLARTGFVSPAQASARLDETLALQAQHAARRRTAAALARERSGIASQLADSELQADAERAEVGRLLAALRQEETENEARRSTVVSAPHDARVTGIAARAGQVVGAGTLLASLIPLDAPLEARLFASTRQAGFVEAGQRVRLRYAAYPYQKFGIGDGMVSSIELSPYAPQELPSHVAATLAGGGDPVYRIAVALDSQTIDTYGKAQALRAGMVFEADILQDRRRLYEWLLEPVYGVVGK